MVTSPTPTTPHRIVLRSLHERHFEKEAAAALSPGHLLVITSADKVQKNAVAAGKIETIIATEDALQGKTITDAYAQGAIVSFCQPLPGDLCYVRVAAAAAAIAVGDFLVPHTDGTIKKGTANQAESIAKAEEAVDNSGGGAEAFIRARFI